MSLIREHVAAAKAMLDLALAEAKRDLDLVGFEDFEHREYRHRYLEVKIAQEDLEGLLRTIDEEEWA